MILNKIRAIYSIIGDFTNLLIQNEQRIKNMLLDYEIQTRVDKLPDGREVKLLLFSQNNIHIRFLPNRVDYDYTINRKDTQLKDIYGYAKEFFKVFGEIFYDYPGNRIAIVLNGFIDDTNNQAIIELTDKLNFSSYFGNCNELQFKINTPKMGKEEYNSVVNIDMGAATNSQTKEKMPVLLLSFDVNTLARNNTPRFYGSNFDDDFSELLKEIENRIVEFEKIS